MNTYKIYKARLNYKDQNKFVSEIKANNLEETNNICKTELNLNPFYATIFENGILIQNKHLEFFETKGI